MPDTDTIPIDENFLRWYKTVCVGDDQRDQIDRRFRGVSELLKGISRGQLDTLIRIVFSKKSTSDQLTEIRAPFKKADDHYDGADERELQILSASSLALLLERNVDNAAFAALGLVTTYLDGQRPLVELPMDLIALARGALPRISEANRTRPNLNDGVSAVAKPNLDTAKKAIQTSVDATNLSAAFDAVADAVHRAMNKTAGELSQSMRRVGTFIKVQDEELQMLWWVFGERSADLDLPFSKVPQDSQPLVFAKELSDATMQLPGPASIKAIMGRAGLKESKKQAIPAAVNACDSSWLESLNVDSAISPILMPIHAAIARKLETGDDESWIAGWSGVSTLDKNRTLSPLTLALQFYYERLQLQF